MPIFLKKYFPVLMIAVLIITGCQLQSESSSDKQPNIIVFLVDDLGWNDTSLNLSGEQTLYNKRYRTPNLETLATQGLTFTNARANPICVPSRVSLLTGQNFMRHQVKGDIEPWENNTKTLLFPAGKVITQPENMLPAMLRKKGYFTVHSGKYHACHMCPPEVSPTPSAAGFDINIGGSSFGAPGSYQAIDEYGNIKQPGRVPGLEKYNGTGIHLTEALTIESLSAVKKAVDNEQPFFLYLAHYAVHTPIQQHKKYNKNYRLSSGEPQAEADYASMIEGVDASLGAVMAALDQWNITDNTIVIFYSDNGGRVLGRGEKSLYGDWEFNFPLRSGKASSYEGGLRVPGVVRWPEKTASNVAIDAPVMIEDIYTTVLTAAGVDVPDDDSIDGKDWSSLFTSSKAPNDFLERELFFIMPYRFDGIHANGPGFADGGVEPAATIIKNNWKLMYFFQDERFELYNLKADIGERNNLLSKEPVRAKNLVKLLDENMRDKQIGGVMPVRLPTKTAIRWPLQAYLDI